MTPQACPAYRTQAYLGQPAGSTPQTNRCATAFGSIPQRSSREFASARSNHLQDSSVQRYPTARQAWINRTTVPENAEAPTTSSTKQRFATALLSTMTSNEFGIAPSVACSVRGSPPTYKPSRNGTAPGLFPHKLGTRLRPRDRRRRAPDCPLPKSGV